MKNHIINLSTLLFELREQYEIKKEELFNDWFIPDALTDVLSQQIREILLKNHMNIYL